MINKKEILKEIITDFHSSPTVKTTERNLEIPTNLQKIISLIGVRRSGKTYLLFNTINKLIQQGVPKQNVLYINFEDERIQLKTIELDLVLQCVFIANIVANLHGMSFILNKIHMKNGFSSMKYKIFLTGKNLSVEFMIQLLKMFL